MEKIWYDPEDPDGYGGISKLVKRVPNGKKETEEWLRGQHTNSLNKPMRKWFPTRAYKTFGVDDLW